ncbi:hypothetical protein LPJ70_000150 [Coemansia sp. RSA 2708]|nr:hypothetical protein LPJ70_000150 [Coemansia sp. RSA 2708]
MSASSALSAADLQFSGYILNGSGGDAHRSSLSHTGAPGNAAAPYDTNAHLLETLGVTGAQPFATQGLSGRDGMAAVSTYGQTLGAAGTANSSMTSTPYQGMPTAGTMPLMEYNSYASLLNKANLLFDNNLDSMTVDW